MKKNKGFTLVELLAVIVILAVIALIATPQILKLINDSRKNSAKDSMYGYIKAVENAYVKSQIDDPSAATTYQGTYTTLGHNNIAQAGGENPVTLALDLKGTAPKEGETSNTLVISNTGEDKGSITCAIATFGDYKVYYDGQQGTACIMDSSDSECNSKTCPVTAGGGGA